MDRRSDATNVLISKIYAAVCMLGSALRGMWRLTAKVATQGADAIRDSPLKSIKELVILVATVVVAIYGVLAYHEYHATNLLESKHVLEEKDRQATTLLIQNLNGKGYCIHTSPLKMTQEELTTYGDGLKMARELVSSLLDSGDLSAKKNFVEFNTVEELYNIIFDSRSELSDASLKNLRDAYFIAELYLYNVYDAFDAKSLGLLEYDSYTGWKAYIADSMGHPIFLAAIYCGMTRGYIGQDFAAELHEELIGDDFGNVLHNKSTDGTRDRRFFPRKMANAIYRDMIDESWPKTANEDVRMGH